MFYIKEKLRVKKAEIVQIQGANALKIRIRVQKGQNASENNELVLYLLYRDCTSSKHRFVESLGKELQSEKRNHIIFFGGININLLDDKNSLEYLNMLMSQGCLSLQNQPTRDRSCLDP